MYTIKSSEIKNYLNEEFTVVEREFFNFLIDNFPENLLNFGEASGYKENEPLLVLMLMIAKIFGESREQILNLEQAKDIKSIIYSLLAADEEEAIPGTITEDELKSVKALKKQNQKLLVLLATELGFEIDYNKLSSDSSGAYIENLKNYYNFIGEYYSFTKNRGTISALYNLLRNFQNVEKNFLLQELEIEKETNTELEIILPSLPAGYTIFKEDKYNLNPESPLYKLIMQIKPAGVVYQLFVKAIAYYILYTNKMLRSAYSAVVESGCNTESGFREYKEIQGTRIVTVPWTDNGTSLNFVLNISTEANMLYNSKVTVMGVSELGLITTIKEEYYKKLSPNNSTLKQIEFNRVDSDASLKKVVILNQVLEDAYDHKNNDVLPIKEFDFPEILSTSKVDLEYNQVNNQIKGTNSHHRQSISSVPLEFKQMDYYSTKTISLSPLGLIGPNNGTATSSPSSLVGNLPKTGKFYGKFTVTRNNKTFILDKETDLVTIKDTLGRRYFPLILDGNFDGPSKYNLNITNPNAFNSPSEDDKVVTNIKVRWEYKTGGNYKLMPTAYSYTIPNLELATTSKSLNFDAQPPYELTRLANKPVGSEPIEHFSNLASFSETPIDVLIAIQLKIGNNGLIGDKLEYLKGENIYFSYDGGFGNTYWQVKDSSTTTYFDLQDSLYQGKEKRVKIEVTILHPSEMTTSLYNIPTYIQDILPPKLISPSYPSITTGYNNNNSNITIRNDNSVVVKTNITDYDGTKTELPNSEIAPDDILTFAKERPTYSTALGMSFTNAAFTESDITSTIIPGTEAATPQASFVRWLISGSTYYAVISVTNKEKYQLSDVYVSDIQPTFYSVAYNVTKTTSIPITNYTEANTRNVWIKRADGTESEIVSVYIPAFSIGGGGGGLPPIQEEPNY